MIYLYIVLSASTPCVHISTTFRTWTFCFLFYYLTAPQSQSEFSLWFNWRGTVKSQQTHAQSLQTTLASPYSTCLFKKKIKSEKLEESNDSKLHLPAFQDQNLDFPHNRSTAPVVLLFSGSSVSNQIYDRTQHICKDQPWNRIIFTALRSLFR